MSLSRTSLRFRFLLLVSLALLLMAGLQIYNVLDERDSRLADLRQETSGIANLSATSVGQLISVSQDALTSLAGVRAANPSPSAVSTFASILLGRKAVCSNLGWIGADGALLASAVQAPRNISFADQLWFRQLQQTRDFTIGEYQIDKLTRQESLVLAQPMPAPAPGKPLEASFVTLPLDTIQRVIARANLPADAVIHVVDRNGIELARWPEIPGFRGNPSQTWTQLKIKTVPQKEAVEWTGTDGAKRFCFFAPVPNSNRNLWVEIETSQASLQAQVRKKMFWHITRAVLLTGLCLTFVWYGSEMSVIRPVRTLIQASRKLAEGDLSARAQVNKGPGELSVLSETFDQMAAALQKQQDELRRTQFAVDYAPEPIMWAALNGRITYANDAAVGAFGFSMSELLNMKFFSIVLSPRAEQWDPHWENLKKERLLIFESRCRARSGKEIPVEITANHLRFGDQEYLCAFIRDITNRKRSEAEMRELNASLEQRVKARTAALESVNASLVAEINERQRIEASLQENERALATLMSNIPGMAYRCLNDSNWTMQVVSEGALELTGYSPEDLINDKVISYGNLIHPEDREKIRPTVNAALEKRSPFRLIYRIQCLNGRTKWVFEQGRGVFDGNGNLRALEGIIHDTTERKLAEEELNQAHQMLELILDNIPQRVFWKDRNFKYLGCNRSFAQAKKLASPQEIVGKTDYDINSTENAESFRADDKWVMDTDTPKVNYEEPLKIPGGGVCWLRTSKIPLHNREGEVIGVLCTYEDITDRREMEQKLRDSLENLERSNRELEQFAYVASHDLQEPLRLISSYTQLLASRYGDKLDATGHEFIGFAVDGAERLRRLIQDLLTYSRVTSQDAPSVPIDSGAALSTALKNLSVVIEENQVEIVKSSMPTVLAAENHLIQLFQNLIGNAIKFRGEQPPRIIVTATLAESRTEWLFRVQDNGIGIAPEYFERIFAIFQRLHSRRKYAGTGIGLAVCKRIVERHGGRIWVESEPGKGSAFLFTLRATNISS